MRTPRKFQKLNYYGVDVFIEKCRHVGRDEEKTNGLKVNVKLSKPTDLGSEINFSN